MNVVLREVQGNWASGYVLDKHMLKAVYVGHDNFGHPQYDKTRTEVGEATFLLKYRSDWAQAPRLAQQLATSICPLFQNIQLIVPMPASTPRPRQPVTEVCNELGRILNLPVFENLLVKAPTNVRLKDLHTKGEKVAALDGTITVNDGIHEDGPWNALLVDDLYDSGASAEAACSALAGYRKIRQVHFAALTWK